MSTQVEMTSFLLWLPSPHLGRKWSLRPRWGEGLGVVWRTDAEFGKLGVFLMEKAVAVLWYPVDYHKQQTPKKATAMEVSQTAANGRTADQKRCANLQRKNQRLRRKCANFSHLLTNVLQQLRQAELEVARKQSEIDFLKQQHGQSDDSPMESKRFFTDPNVYGHRFAASMVALCANLANVMAIRAVPRALSIVMSTLGISTLIPDRETITRWCKRLGVDRLKQNQTEQRWKNHKDMIWIVDHSNQIGTQKALVILAIPASELPSKGQTLSLDALEVLAIEPGESWTRDDMRRVYQELVDLVGRPRFVLCDGAVELRESVDVLCDENHDVVVLRDFKHFAANRFESMIGRSKEFREFQAAIGKTRCRIQQTELAHLNPPALKTKSRFMNITPVISWAQMVLGVLDDPEAEEFGVSDVQKLHDRLGWLQKYRDLIASWKRCCEVIGWSLAWINTQGLEQNSGELLHQHLERLRDDRCELSDRMQEKLVAFVTSSASQLQSGERSWLSSESLESAFGLLKRREGQQSRSGFTGLITTLPALLRTWSAGEVRSALRRTSTKKLNEWVAKNVGATLWSRRARAFKHFGERKCHVFATL